MHYLYKITNQINLKVYIGQTKDHVKRWQQHQYISQKTTKKQYIHKALNKYGISNFTFEIIDFGIYSWQADCLEFNYIKQYDSRNPDKGYNVSPGGWHAEMSAETRQKMSEARKGKVPGNKGLPSPYKGIPRPQTVIDKMKVIAQLPENRLKKSIRLKQWHATHESPLKGKTFILQPEDKRYLPRSPEASAKHAATIKATKDKLLEPIKILHEQGLSTIEIGKQLGIFRKTVAKYLKELGISKRNYCSGKTPWNKDKKTGKTAPLARQNNLTTEQNINHEK